MSINHLYNSIQNKLNSYSHEKRDKNDEQTSQKVQTSVKNMNKTKLNVNSTIKKIKKRMLKVKSEGKKELIKLLKIIIITVILNILPAIYKSVLSLSKIQMIIQKLI